MRGDWCDWHVICVEYFDDAPDDTQIWVMHPGCHFAYDSQGNHFEWRCAIQWEIDNVGYETLLGDQDKERSGWYRARIRAVELRGFDWTEIDTEYEVEPIGVRAADQKTWLPVQPDLPVNA